MFYWKCSLDEKAVFWISPNKSSIAQDLRSDTGEAIPYVCKLFINRWNWTRVKGHNFKTNQKTQCSCALTRFTELQCYALLIVTGTQNECALGTRGSYIYTCFKKQRIWRYSSNSIPQFPWQICSVLTRTRLCLPSFHTCIWNTSFLPWPCQVLAMRQGLTPTLCPQEGLVRNTGKETDKSNSGW